MKIKTLKASRIVYRYLPNDAVYALTLAKSPRAFIRSGHGNVEFTEGATGERWLETDLAEALNAIIAGGYTQDKRHPVIAALNALRAEVA